jgi:hypothetical protein
MVPSAAYGLTKVAREQAEWAAQTALRIFAGSRPADIPIVRNQQTRCYVNSERDAKIRFSPSGVCTPLKR